MYVYVHVCVCVYVCGQRKESGLGAVILTQVLSLSPKVLGVFLLSKTPELTTLKADMTREPVRKVCFFGVRFSLKSYSFFMLP